ncbi:SctW family type III secretion system gatekeeper subunit BsaP [Burkholderia thailandensis]|uniref:SctW family type III secretion system gatekeeper subunit BsaP n=1 Tax=Burkholderia thailandensis TaxID=57975 RepID=UPI00016A576E|nr:SctW family type III secretion system gatekeeper subunit BsaP [Burkholderia thailandensis]AIP66389.1 type III secretion protein [Burkholderia thailandensis]AOI54477.1 type III secretion protein [Burkholderia thailandensis]MCZ2896915.1 SctW family type III secretion system gatekeeper subunit BsaP [Burkholderia thailandensis]MCZ2901870.1 SctW family type III secretion system gatekeeper subunit BsaP [Burkholderia thailandensis]MDD1480374.1 YopN family type III secretion system gatekeeper subun
MSSIIGGASAARRGFSIDGTGSAANRLDAEPSLDDAPQTGAAGAADVQAQLAGVDEEAANAAAQFGRFRASERKGRRSDDLERILDTDADEKLDELAALLGGRASRGRVDLATLLRDARERFRDESDLLLALRELRRRRRLDGESVDVVERAIDELLAGDGNKRIKAGINAALKAKVFGARMQLDPCRLRELYRQFLEFDGSHLVVYEDWIEQFGASRRKRILDYVSAALSYDMQSHDPSCGCAAEFGPLLGTLHRARMLASADELFVGRLLDDALARDCGLTEERALATMLGGLQRPFSVADVLLRALGDLLEPLSAARRSQLLQLALRAFAGVPIALYGDADARRAALGAIEALIGATYARERRLARPHADAG